MLVVDLSASGSFGTINQTKNALASELCALLAFSAVKNNDKVGLLIFTDTVEHFIPPQKGATHVLRIIRDVLAFTPRKAKTNIAQALDYVGRVMNKRGVVFLVSDFQCDNYEKSLRILSKRHDLIAASISDPREHQLPNLGLIEMEDAETGERVLVDTGNREVRKRYETLCYERTQQLRETLASMNVDQVDLSTEREYIRDLVRFFRRRERRA